jgi:hypothetical protein
VTGWKSLGVHVGAYLHRLAPGVLALLALGLAVLGQRRFVIDDWRALVEGLLLYGLAALCLVVARQTLLYLNAPESLTMPGASQGSLHRRALRISPWRLGMLFGAVLIATALVVAAVQGLPHRGERAYLLAWFAATVLVTAPWLPPRSGLRVSLARAAGVISPYRAELSLLALLTLMGGLLRLLAPGQALVTLLGALAIPALYLLARQLVGWRAALVSGLFLATMPLHLQAAAIAPLAMWDTFFYPAILALFWWGMRDDREEVWPFALAGLAAGLAQYVPTTSRLMPFLLALYVIYLLLSERRRAFDKLPRLGVLALVFAVVGSPLYLYAAQQSLLLLQPFAPGAEQSLALAPLVFPFLPVAGAAPSPPLLGVALYFGLAISVLRWREPGIILLHGWFWAIILAAAVLNVSTPLYRLVAVTPAICLFAALGWQSVAFTLSHARAASTRARVQHLCLAILAAATALASLYAYSRYPLL